MHKRILRLLIGVTVLGSSNGAAQELGDASGFARDRATAPVTYDGRRLAPGDPMPVEELEAFVDGVIMPAMLRDHIAGAAVAIVQADRVVLTKGYGFADLESKRSVDPGDTLFRIGSITKTFTWIALLRRVESGRLGIDDVVNDHLPPKLRVPDQGFTRPIRIRDLLTHTAGFEDRVLGRTFVRDPAALLALDDHLAERRPDRVREPGSLPAYSNYGVALAGAMLEHLDGKPWQTIIEEEILEPLALASTTGREPYPAREYLPEPLAAGLAARVATGYRWAGTRYVPRPFEFMSQIAPAGAMSSTADDIARYMLVLLNDGELDGVRVFGSQAAAALRTPLTGLPAEVGNLTAGLFETPLEGGFRGYGHAGTTPSFHSGMTIVPELDLGVFVATNSEGGRLLAGTVLWRLVERFYAHKAPPANGDPQLLEVANRYVGTYLVARRAYGGLEGFLRHFQSAVSVNVTPDGYLVMAPQGVPVRFVPTAMPGAFRSVDVPAGIVFEAASGELATRALTPAMGLERAAFLDRSQTLLQTSVAAAIAALVIVVGLAAGRGNMGGLTPLQRSIVLLRGTAAIAWLVALTVFIIAVSSATSDPDSVILDWPMPSVVVFSANALLAGLLTLAALTLSPALWRAATWSAWRKLRFSASLGVFALLTVILGHWGALEPWRP